MMKKQKNTQDSRFNGVRSKHAVRCRLCAVALAVGMAFGLGGCGTKNADDEESYRIAVICKGSEHQFWQTARMGAEDACEELGVDVSMTFEAPEDESQIEEQVKMVQKAIDDDVDGILLAPLDTDKLNDVVEQASGQGIKIVTFDSSVNSDIISSEIGTDNYAAGAIAARNAVALIDNEKPQIAIVAHVKGAETTVGREQGFADEIMELTDQQAELIPTVYADGDIARSKEAMLKLLDKYGTFDLVYATNEGSAVGVAEALEEKGMTSEIPVVGFDSSDDEIAYLKNGAIDGMVVQNPYNMGYLGIRNLYKVMRGDTVESRIVTGTTYVDKTNVADEDVEWLLYPMGTSDTK
jgi:ribose transport system substrate-binding protein